MIDHLHGVLVSLDASSLVIRVGGVGFRLDVPQGAYADRSPGDELEVPTLLSVRQDGMSLYGFANPTEREFFSLLTSISGIGPRSALGILSHASPGQLAEAILKEDISALTQVKGIGKKGARRIIVELAEKIRALRQQASAGLDLSTDPCSPQAAGLRAEAMEVLLSLGCRPDEASDALDQVMESLDLDDEEAADLLVMRALRALSGG